MNKERRGSDKSYLTIDQTQKSEYDTFEITKDLSMWDLYKGMVYMFFSCLGFTGISLFAKILLRMKPDFTSFELLTFRTFILFWGSALAVCGSGTNIFANEIIKSSKIVTIIIRSVLATFTISLLIYAIKYIDASDVYTIFYCYPAFVVILGLIFTKDKAKCLDYFCLLACLIGVVCIVRPAFIFGESKKEEGNKTLYFLCALAAALTKSTEVVLVRDIAHDIHFLAFPLFFAIFGLVLFPIPMVINVPFRFNMRFDEVIVLSCISISSWCYHAFLAMSLRLENAGRVSMINYIQIPLLLITDLIWFEKKFNVFDVFGTLLIFTFNFGSGIYKAYIRTEKLEKLQEGETKEKSKELDEKK